MPVETPVINKYFPSVVVNIFSPFSQSGIKHPVQRKTQHGKSKSGQHQQKGRLQHPIIMAA
jgi:hypothetical protein